jgi:predicted RNA-binding Zn-ribbon protein involved in translation (DUF1610 family)
VEEMKQSDTIIRNYINNYEIMSKNRRIIELAPPEYGVVAEREELRGFLCPKCGGSGYRMDYGVRDAHRIECPTCGGVGKLRATVTIEWAPDAGVDNEINL